MPTFSERTYEKNDGYRLRVLSCTAGAILLLILIFTLWPLPGEPELDPFPYHTGGQELIAIEDIMPTRQSRKPPPPPPPMIPMIVPDDIFIEDEIEIKDAFLTLEEYGVEEDLAEGTAGEAKSAKAPEVGPKPLRFVEPEYTREARRKNVKAEVVIEVFVDEMGKVQEAKIVQRYIYSKDNKQKKTVSSLSYGLEESALSAAQRWTFRPAHQNGSPVQSYTTLTFSFGV